MHSEEEGWLGWGGEWIHYRFVYCVFVLLYLTSPLSPLSLYLYAVLCVSWFSVSFLLLDRHFKITSFDHIKLHHGFDRPTITRRN